MPPLKKNEKVMLVLIAAAAVAFAAMDPYYLIWKKKPAAPPPKGKGGAPVATAPAKPGPAAPVAAAGAAAAVKVATPVVNSMVASQRVAYEGWHRDPFVRARAYMDQQINLSDLKLGAISVRKQDRYALINSRVVRAGDVIAGMTVDRIERDRVILVSGGRSYTITWER